MTKIHASELEAGDTIVWYGRNGPSSLTVSAIATKAIEDGPDLILVEGTNSIIGSPYTTPRRLAYSATELVEVDR